MQPAENRASGVGGDLMLSSTSWELKPVASESVVGTAKQQKLWLAVLLISEAGYGSVAGVGQLFKIPELHNKHAAKPESKGKEKADVFGDVKSNAGWFWEQV